MSEPHENQVEVKFIRKTLSAWARDISLRVDGVLLAHVPHGGKISAVLTPGKHVVQVGSGQWFSSSREQFIHVSAEASNTWVLGHTWPYNRFRIVSIERWQENRFAEWFSLPRVHLSTALVCMILAGALMGLNMRPGNTPNSIFDTERTYSSVQVHSWGFPFTALREFKSPFPGFFKDERRIESGGFCLNLVFAASFVMGMGVVLEWKAQERPGHWSKS